jgi:4'-phosphopantetheinyl transferase
MSKPPRLGSAIEPIDIAPLIASHRDLAESMATVKLWRIAGEDVDVPTRSLLEILGPEERRQAEARRTEAGCRAYALSHACLRTILAAETGADPAAVRYARPSGRRGKPVLLDNPDDLGFNLSHTTELILVGLVRGREIGVDAEWLGRRVDHDSLARRYFTPSEWDTFAAVPSGERSACFLRLWTRREAHAKMTGEGIRRAMATGTEASGPFGGERSRLLDLDLTPGHTGAVAVQARPQPPPEAARTVKA